MHQGNKEQLSGEEYRRQVEQGLLEANRQYEIRQARLRAARQLAPAPQVRNRTTLVNRIRSERLYTRRNNQASGSTTVYERPSPPRPKSPAPLDIEAAGFFNSWLMENVSLSPSEETWQRCLCAAVAAARRDRMPQTKEFLEDVRFFYGCWEREVEFETRFDRR